jgi:L-asparaginase/Glu-tRNA(Gln) amidotransferase subunit D
MLLGLGVAAALCLAAEEKKPVVFVADKNSVQVPSSEGNTEVTGGGSGNAMTDS